MENRSCKLCVKSFSNGRALGGHMRSHVPYKTEHETEYSSPPSPSPATAYPPPEIEDRELLGYGLRENPRKSVKLVDQELNLVVLQDRESETESSKNKNPVRRRSKRIRKPETAGEPETKRIKPGRPDQANNSGEPEPVSSVSDATTEEDVAYCLMMLSRDKWRKSEQNQIISSQYDDVEEEDETEDEDEEEEEHEDLDEELDEEIDEIAKYKKTQKAAKGKYKCETCYKVFKSYQALGGHRASHKKNRAMGSVSSVQNEIEPRNANNEEKIHECPVCFRVFSSGQALGGHKRSHVLGSAATTSIVNANNRAPAPSRFAENLIDLNLPAPVDDDEYSQFELSAVSDAEFVNSIKH